MNDPIDECVANFGPAPRTFSLSDRLNYLRVEKPLWLLFRRSDNLQVLFQNATTLFIEGTVVWGHVIQANELLFQDGPDDCPGEVVYSLQDQRLVSPQNLEEIAQRL